MDYDRKRYPGLYSLRETLRSRTKLPSPEGGTSLMDNVPMRAQPDRKTLTTPRPSFIDKAGTAGMAINALQEGRDPSQARKTLGDWGAKKFAGGMTTDQFVSLAGALSHAIAPRTPQGRVGAVMSQFGQQEQQKRTGMAETLRQERLKKAETLRLEDREAKRFRTKSLLGVGKEERGYEHAKGMAETLAGTKKSEAEKTQSRWEKGQARLKGQHALTQAGIERRHKINQARLREQDGAGKGEKDITPSEKWKREKDIKAAEMNILDPGLLEDPRIQTEIDYFNEHTDKPYFYQRTEGTPGKETGWFDLERDVEATPSTIEKIDVSTPEKIRDSDLPYETKLKLLQTRFGAK